MKMGKVGDTDLTFKRYIPEVQIVAYDYEDLEDGVLKIPLPAGLLLGVAHAVVEEFEDDEGTESLLDIGDTDADDTFIANTDVDMTVVGNYFVNLEGKYYVETDLLQLKHTFSGDSVEGETEPAQGQGILYLFHLPYSTNWREALSTLA